MTTATTFDSGAAANQLNALRTELDLLETRRAKIDEELVDCEFPAVALHDPEAIARRKDLTEQRAACDRRIASGEVHVRRLEDAERECQRQQWQAKADELRDRQLAAARRVDAALAELESAHADYLDSANERSTATRNAGGTWWNAKVLPHLSQAIYGSPPRIADHLRLSRLMAHHASKLEDLV